MELGQLCLIMELNQLCLIMELGQLCLIMELNQLWLHHGASSVISTWSQLHAT